MKLKVIVTGSSTMDMLFSRWGVSFLIGDDLLFDTFGDPPSFQENMQRMNMSLAAVKYVVISHDHWDHTGGLWSLLEANPAVAVYACPGFGNEFKEKVRSFGSSLIEADMFAQIKAGIHTTGEIASFATDMYIAEQSLVIDNGKNLSVISGCAHPGITTIVRAAREYFEKDVTAIIGGFHLREKTDDEIISITNDLRKLGIQRIYSTHCTGEKAELIFKKEVMENFTHLKTGDTITLP